MKLQDKCVILYKLLFALLVIRLPRGPLSALVHCRSSLPRSSSSALNASANDEAISPEVNGTLTPHDKIGKFHRLLFDLLFFFSSSSSFCSVQCSLLLRSSELLRNK